MYNHLLIGSRSHEADPVFYGRPDSLRRLELAGAFSLRLHRRGSAETGTRIVSRKLGGKNGSNPDFVHADQGLAPERSRWLATPARKLGTIAVQRVGRDSRSVGRVV